MAVVGAKSRSSYMESMDEKQNEFLRTGTVTYIIVQGGGTEASGEGKVIMGSDGAFFWAACERYVKKLLRQRRTVGVSTRRKEDRSARFVLRACVLR